MINRGYNLNVKEALENKNYSVNFCLCPVLVYCKKNQIPTSFGFCVIALQIYREIIKKYRFFSISLCKLSGPGFIRDLSFLKALCSSAIVFEKLNVYNRGFFSCVQGLKQYLIFFNGFSCSVDRRKKCIVSISFFSSLLLYRLKVVQGWVFFSHR